MDEARPATGSAVVAAGRVKVSGEAVRIGEPEAGGPLTEPQVKLVREDGVIRVIEVTCRCGEVIRVRCEYS
jgi:hypothetical protein